MGVDPIHICICNICNILVLNACLSFTNFLQAALTLLTTYDVAACHANRGMWLSSAFTLDQLDFF